MTTDGDEALFVLQTHCGTVVYIDEASGRLVHGPLRDFRPNFILTTDEQRILRVYEADSSLPPHAVTEAFRGGFVERVAVADTPFFGLRCNGNYACPADDGTVEFSRSSIGGWEQFTKLSLPRAVRQMSSEAAEAALSLARQRRMFSIPKTIHQVFFSGSDHTRRLPERIAENVRGLRSANPEWRFTLWTEKDAHDFIYDGYGYDILAAFLRISPRYPAARVDLFRYLCIYKQGGVYLDVKSSCARPLSQILLPDDEYLLSQWNNDETGGSGRTGLHDELGDIRGGEYQQWHLIGAPGHPFLESTISCVIRNIFAYSEAHHGTGTLGVLRTTGPIAYTKALQPITSHYHHRLIRAEDCGFVFNAIGSTAGLFRPHYSTLADPIVL